MFLDDNWMSSAKCLNKDTDTFFPESCDKECAAEAKKMCLGCRVQEQCLNYAIIHQLLDGIWGGMCSRERKKVARLEPWRRDGKQSHPCLVGDKVKKHINNNGTGIRMGRLAI